MTQSSDALSRFRDRLSLPLIAAPMFLVSGTDLVVAACRNGVIGSFPTVNCRSPEQLDQWLTDIDIRLEAHSDASGKPAAPVCANLIVHRSNARLEQDLQVLLRHRPEMVITSVGSPAPVLKPLHDTGALVFADVASIRHAERAVAAGRSMIGTPCCIGGITATRGGSPQAKMSGGMFLRTARPGRTGSISPRSLRMTSADA